MSLCRSVTRLLGQPLRHVLVGGLDLGVDCARVGELVACVRVLQVPQHARQVGGDVVVAVLLSDDLMERAREERRMRRRRVEEIKEQEE